jgi:predicted TIM-barrel fold metal-dependent hydrolase
MDMEYMGAGKPKDLFKEQLNQLKDVKIKREWNNKIYPFIFCDPRRIKPTHKREIGIEKEFIGETFLQTVKQYVESGTYSGIKIYPALGYYPFDQRMQPVYDLALSLDLPVLTHCTIGAVHFKYELDKEEYHHPFLDKYLPEQKPAKFQEFFTHPLNFECLLNHDLLKKVWGNDAPDYSQLKICIAHWGTEEEWHLFLENPWVQTKLKKPDGEYPALSLNNWNIEKTDDSQYVSWFSIICDLIIKYPNVYTDISYTLNDTSLLPLLKMTLEANEKIRERVLFGTDFYMVSKAISESEFAINVRAALGKELFEQIAITNTERFLSNKLYPMPLAW